MAMTKLTAVVGDAHGAALLPPGPGHIGVVSVGDAGQVTPFP